MIHEISSSRAGFKKFQFNKGLNIVLAEQTMEAGSVGISNSSGKSSLVEIVYFLMGGGASDTSPLKNPKVRGTPVSMRLDVADQQVDVTRIINKNDVTAELDGKKQVFDRKVWKQVLGERWYGVPQAGYDLGSDEPTAGRILPFLARVERGGGMEKPDKSWAQGRLSQSSATVAFLLGLPWRAASAWGELKDRERIIKNLVDLQGLKFLERVFGETQNLEDELKVLDAEIAKLATLLEERKVGEARVQVADRAEELQRRARAAGDEVMENARSLRTIERALSSTGKDEAAQRFAQNLKGELGSLVVKRLEKIEEFQVAVLNNRKMYLAEERQKLLDRQLPLRNRHTTVLEELRKEVAAASTGGIWAEYEAHVKTLAERRGRREALANRIAAVKALEDEKSALAALKKDRETTMNEALTKAQGHAQKLNAEFKDIVKSAIGSDALKAELKLEATSERLVIEPEIESDSGKGVNNIRIWAFDLLMKHMEGPLGYKAGILVHDSHLFEPIDPAKVPDLLRVAKRRAEQEGWQYIVTLNAGALATAASDAELRDCINPQRLTDAPDGGLFGFRF